MRVVHINVRLSEGGAAKIMLDLHQRSVAAGIESQVFYGYGTGAKPSPQEVSIAGAKHVANRAHVMMNYVTHRLSGIEFFPPVGAKAALLSQAVLNADVVHLHAVHSYFLPFNWLSNLLLNSKKVVWTCHDYWPITGRCAFIEGCDAWKRGCGECPSGLNYPSSLLDYSSSVFKQRRGNIERLMNRMIFVAPSNFVRDQFQEALPNAQVYKIYNGVDAELERAASRIVASNKSNTNGLIKILVMASDLSDPTKTDQSLVNRMMAISGIELHTIGKNSPFQGDAIVNHGEIFQRDGLADIMQDMDALLFTSKKDTFGLVMIEAMYCGVPVLALPSEAANEVLELVGQQPKDAAEILNILSNTELRDAALMQLKERLSKSKLKIFSGQSMFDSYRRIYSHKDFGGAGE